MGTLDEAKTGKTASSNHFSRGVTGVGDDIERPRKEKKKNRKTFPFSS
jgi:hypothetical protein